MTSVDCSGLTVGEMVALGRELAAEHPGEDVHLRGVCLVWGASA